MTLRYIESPSERGHICESILRSLPLWFGIEKAIVDYTTDVQLMDTWAAFEADRPIGFISINQHNPFTAEVHVMGILESHHRGGLGRRLLNEEETFLATSGFKFLEVKTLSELRPNPEYEKTRRFYLSSGFYPVEEFKTLWGEDNPCLLMIKTLVDTQKGRC